jgi:hypothetical protein
MLPLADLGSEVRVGVQRMTLRRRRRPLPAWAVIEFAVCRYRGQEPMPGLFGCVLPGITMAYFHSAGSVIQNEVSSAGAGLRVE